MPLPRLPVADLPPDYMLEACRARHAQELRQLDAGLGAWLLWPNAEAQTGTGTGYTAVLWTSPAEPWIDWRFMAEGAEGIEVVMHSDVLCMPPLDLRAGLSLGKHSPAQIAAAAALGVRFGLRLRLLYKGRKDKGPRWRTAELCRDRQSEEHVLGADGDDGRLRRFNLAGIRGLRLAPDALVAAVWDIDRREYVRA